MKRHLAAICAGSTLVMAASACSRSSEGVTRNGKPPVAVEVMTLARADLAESVAVVGSVSPKLTAELRSEVTSVVDAVLISEWVRVRKGQPLARLNTRDAEAALEAVKAALAQARVAETRATRELERAQKLRQVGLLTQQGLDDARSAQEAAGAAVAAAEAQLEMAETHLSKSTIRAPFDGVVAHRGVGVGDRVENMGGDPMFRIVDNRVLQLTVTVPSTRSAGLRVGQTLTFTVDALPGKTFSGEVMHVNPTVDPVSRSVKVVADVPNPEDQLRGGMFASGRIVTGTRPAVLQIPRSALLSWDLQRGEGSVLVLGGEVAEQRTVKTGIVAGDAVEITFGLEAGERVITRGGFNVKSGDRVKVANHPEA